jgi:hypothetical protein
VDLRAAALYPRVDQLLWTFRILPGAGLSLSLKTD